MPDIPLNHPTSSQARTGLFVALLAVVSLVMDGPPQVASSLLMQMFLLPFTLVFLACSFYFLSLEPDSLSPVARRCIVWVAAPRRLGWSLVLLEVIFILLYVYQTRHFAQFGYRLSTAPVGILFTLIIACMVFLALRAQVVPSWVQLTIYLVAYCVGQILSIAGFPLIYLRSDMLPVVFWADRALLAGQNAYQHFYVADRIYDFPYLPGTLLAYAPAEALRVDLRWASIFYVVAGMLLVYGATAPLFRRHAALLVGLYVLCPYLQYRHELYTQAHFFSLILIFVLLQRRLFLWSAAVFGVSMVISQFSWVIFPFFLLYALRRGSWKEVARMITVVVIVAIGLLFPFLHAGAGNIAHNAVGQWDRLVRPIARPMNLAFWMTYVVRPSNLKWVQLALLSTLFLFCWVQRRCSNLTDTLRWMIVALLTFILLNVLVDGYFYLMLLVPMLVYTCVANGWWSEGQQHSSSSTPARQANVQV